MAHPQVPYDPLLDVTHPDQEDHLNYSRHSTPHSIAQDVKDPIAYYPSPRRGSPNPDLYASGGLGASTGAGGDAGMPGIGLGHTRGGIGGMDFGPPVPRFLSDATRSSTYSSSSLGVGDRQSQYGSIAPLRDQRDSAYRDHPPSDSPPLGTAVYPPGASPPVRRYTDDPQGRTYGVYDMYDKDNLYAAPRAKSKKKGILIAAVASGLLVIIAAIVIPVYFFVIKKDGGKTSTGNTSVGGGDGGSTTTTGPSSQQVLTTGGDGSIVTKEDGSTFVYNNTFGGYWVYDVNNPLNESARAQSHSPPLSQPWRYGIDRIYGVNLGGWLNLEPFISPALFEPFNLQAVDEYTLSTLLRQRDGNLDAIANHYATFITEEDFAQIAAAGLNWLRIPLPFWAIETYPGEPFLPKVSWTYFLKAIEWARKYGLRINLDLHAVPGSQNPWNHSGKQGSINFLNGVMGIANAQRALDYIRIIAEFISQPEYRNIVPFFGIINEPLGLPGNIPEAALRSFYAEAYRIIRTAGGSGTGNGPIISIHDGFLGLGQWNDFLAGADRLAMDLHPYLAFGEPRAGNPIDFATAPCTQWATDFGNSMSTIGITAAGEWSHAINDCGLYFNEVGAGTRYEGTYRSSNGVGSCTQWNDYTTWGQDIKDGIKELSKSSMDALGDWFFWTWRIGESLDKGRVEAPFWSYKLAIQEGWAVLDPRESTGQCARLGAPVHSFYATGGTLSGAQIGVGVVDAITGVPSLANYVWPPAAIGLFPDASALPRYTPTGPIPTLPVTGAPRASVTGTAVVPSATATVSLGTGWTNAADQGLMHVPIPGCAYPDTWNAEAAAVPVC